MTSTRRRFLATSLVSTAALGTNAIARTETCGLAIGTYGLQAMPLEKAIDLIAETGFDGLEITTFRGSTGDRSGALIERQKREEIRDRIADSGLRLVALMVDLKPQEDEATHRGQLSDLVGQIKLAHDLSPGSPPLLQTVLSGKDWEKSKTMFRDRLADWNRILADQKGYLSIKPHRGHAMKSPADAKWLLDQLGNPRRLKMVYDYSHYAFREPEFPVSDSVVEALPITNYVALKDALLVDGKIMFGLPGDSGMPDHAEVIGRFFGGGYRGDFCCEVSSQVWRNNLDYDPVAATKLCYGRLSKAFERAGVPRG